MTATENQEQNKLENSLSDSGVRNVLSPGTMLRQKREASNLELSSISRELNLDTWMLNALENDEFSKFTAQVFAKGHLKHYAQYLGLNSEDVLFAYYQVAERKDTAPVINQQLSLTTPKKSFARFSRWFMWLLGIMAIGALVYATYQWSVTWLQGARESSNSISEQSLNPEDAVAEIQSNSNLAVPVKQSVDNLSTEQTVEPASETVSIDEPALTVEPVLSNLETVATLNTPVPDYGLNNQSSETVPARDTQTDVSPQSPEILRFNFLESSWVEVFGVNGKRLIYGMANQGTVREIALSGPTEIFLGNAQGTRITLNGSAYNIPANARAGRTARFVLEPDR